MVKVRVRVRVRGRGRGRVRVKFTVLDIQLFTCKCLDGMGSDNRQGSATRIAWGCIARLPA
jgi:hypothetical protein